ncbi:MAG: STAS domain-containing protein [Armatimonadota bacterium]
MDFEVGINYLNDLAVVNVIGDVDLHTASLLRDCLNKLIEDGTTRIMLDLQDCAYFDSEGIKALIWARRTVGDGGSIAIGNAKGAVRRLLQISGLHRIFSITPQDELP